MAVQLFRLIMILGNTDGSNYWRFLQEPNFSVYLCLNNMKSCLDNGSTQKCMSVWTLAVWTGNERRDFLIQQMFTARMLHSCALQLLVCSLTGHTYMCFQNKKVTAETIFDNYQSQCKVFLSCPWRKAQRNSCAPEKMLARAMPHARAATPSQDTIRSGGGHRH